MKKQSIIIIGAIIIVAVLYFVFAKSPVQKTENTITVSAKKGDFIIDITTTGELEAKNSVKIMGPTGLRRASIWEIKIAKLIEEGSIVEKGGFIASLDNSTLNDRISDRLNDLEQRQSEFTKAKLDTAINLRKLRDELVNKKYAVEEKELVLEQSQFEPPATIKQNELDLEKAKRAYSQAIENYELEKEKAVAETRKAYSRYMERKRDVEFLESLQKDMVIEAPEPGMVIYSKDFRGEKKKEGDMLRTWDPVIAELPDLTKMISKTYVNEVDIRKISKGQEVDINLDAFPDKKLTGEVIKVANVGEQKENSDAKVFQVDIEIFESDTTLRPGMTTGNKIIADIIKNVVYIPLESLHNQGDSVNYVFKKNGLNLVRQQVAVGKTNANEAVIENGLEEGDLVLLNVPNDAESIKLVALKEESEIEPLTSTE